VVEVAIGTTTDQGRYIVVVADEMILYLRISSLIVILSREGYAYSLGYLSESSCGQRQRQGCNQQHIFHAHLL
jgi:hypothetical protein